MVPSELPERHWEQRKLRLETGPEVPVFLCFSLGLLSSLHAVKHTPLLTYVPASDKTSDKLAPQVEMTKGNLVHAQAGESCEQKCLRPLHVATCSIGTPWELVTDINSWIPLQT